MTYWSNASKQEVKKMKSAKKIIFLIVTAVLVLTLTACGSGNGSGSSSSDSSSGSSQSSQKSSKSNGKTLVVYFSGTGNTKSVAEKIAKDANADLFEIQPSDPYTDDDLDYNNDDSRVNKEHEDESLQDVELKTTKVKNWDNYDTVLFGYPIWWGDAAWPVNNFVKDNDFSGKTVIPFCTSFSSGIGSSGENLEKMAGSGKWQKGHRFEEDASSGDVSEWVDGLDLD